MSEVQETVPYKLWRIRLESSLKFRGNGEFYGEFFRWGGSGEGRASMADPTYAVDGGHKVPTIASPCAPSNMPCSLLGLHIPRFRTEFKEMLVHCE